MTANQLPKCKNCVAYSVVVLNIECGSMPRLVMICKISVNRSRQPLVHR